MGEDLEAVFRREAGRCTATLIRVLGDVDLAEDAVAEAFAIAVEQWPIQGIPPNPGAWITVTARNRAVDRLRREATRADHYIAAYRLRDDVQPEDTPEMPDLDALIDAVPDDQLRLLFLCCHPALSVDAQVSLTLKLASSLTVAEIGRAFLVPEATIAQRIVRAKRKLRDNHAPYRIPREAELPSRLHAVLSAIYLIYNEGHTATSGDDLARGDLCLHAIRLARAVVELMVDEPEAAGLLALLLLTQARQPARVDADGSLVRLADQNRTRWERPLIEEGHRLVRDCLRRNRPGPLQIQAAIAAVHADAYTSADTDWAQIVALYDQLMQLRPDAVVALNRAVALAERSGWDAGLSALDELDGEALAEYQPYHAARADLLARAGRQAQALEAYDRALELTSNPVERQFLIHRRDDAQHGRGSAMAG